MSTAVAEVTPGVYDMSAEDYHKDPVREQGGSLSSTGARKILACPALYRHEQDNPQPPKKHFDYGTAAHKLVLGDGPELVRVDHDNWRSKKAQDARDEAHARGAIPLLTHEYQQVHDMAAALREHPVASALFAPDSGKPEQTLIWVDRRTGVWRRARFDWLRNPGSGRLLIPDYKTTANAAPEAAQKSIYNFGYHQQGDFYEDAPLALGMAEEAVFLLVFQEKTPPYLITVVQPDPDAMRIAAARNRQAIDKWIECRESGHWPGYGDDIHLLPLPPWALNRELDDLEEYL